MTFWNKVQSGMSRAAAEAEKQARIARLNMQLHDVEGTIRQQHQTLGEAALQLVRDGKLSDPALDSAVKSIDEQETRLAELKEQLAEAQNSAPPAGESA
jgi:uncharacterized protein with GYD domain